MKLQRRRHPDDKYTDEARIRVVERYKTSDLSGDEWRFSYVVELSRKGVVYAKAVCGNTPEYAAVLLSQGLILGLAELETLDAWETLPFEKIPDEGYCCQPGCPEKSTRKYAMQKEWSDGCWFSKDLDVESSGVLYREFCDKHGQRGDCGLDDTNSNYTCIEGNDWNNAPADPSKISESIGPLVQRKRSHQV